ncbi:hypothetical protein F8166_09760 [Bacillus cereus]|uniref:hypothetical protein n=1 Tax=Bacillus cereus group TaxID=86661 RepID=UPI001239C928|nr:hypothetical protein [Bacillus cereus]KAA6455913.1 hypothetical protein DX930_31360 [Bacillus cereus]KAB2437045.1 hypothetical protein F8166_09760 [Bacillus cereus]KAB2469874.1 hypothetical protein F8164_05320 [Bacillus cereus]
MKKIPYLCSVVIVSLGLIGCSNTIEKTNSSGSKKVENYEDSVLSIKKEISEIKLTRVEDNKISKSETYNEDLIKEFNKAIQNSTSEKIDLKKQKEKKSVCSNMTVTFKDDSKEEFLVWNENNNQIIITKDTNEKSTQGLKLNKKTPKMVTNLLNNLK